ncbi:hypothetical protein MCOR02_005364 [Pyricularia oryzae]|nr:hypothetical protein MCOR02_005364 [Pyricularia oryzae]
MALASKPAPLLIRKQAGKLLRCSFAPQPRGISSICTSRLHTTSPRAAVRTPQPAALTRRPHVASSQSGPLCLQSRSRHAQTRPKKKSEGPDTLDRDLMFTSQDVPLSKEWDEKRERLLKEGMEADAVRLDTESCIKEAMRFADEVAKAGNDWRPIRARDLKFSASSLYYMAMLLRTAPMQSHNAGFMAKQMFLSAGEMGYGPAIITNASLVLNDVSRRPKPQLPPRNKAIDFWSIMDRFTRYARSAKQDPNIMTLSGILAMYQGDNAKATKLLLAAEQAGRTQAARQGDRRPPPRAEADSPAKPGAIRVHSRKRLPRWDLEVRTLLVLGTLLENSGQRDAAITAFSTAANELQVPEAHYHLALLLSPMTLRGRNTCPSLPCRGSRAHLSRWPRWRGKRL